MLIMSNYPNNQKKKNLKPIKGIFLEAVSSGVKKFGHFSL